MLQVITIIPITTTTISTVPEDVLVWTAIVMAVAMIAIEKRDALGSTGFTCMRSSTGLP